MATVQWVREAGGASDPDAMSRAVHRGSVGYPVVSCACRVTPGCPCLMVHDCISSMRASAAKYTGVGSGREARAGMVGRRLHATTDNYRRGPSMAGRCLRCMHIRVVTRVCVLACVRALEIASRQHRMHACRRSETETAPLLFSHFVIYMRCTGITNDPCD